MKLFKQLVVCFAVMGCLVSLAFAGESSAVLGAENYYAGALPPPGFHIVDYSMFYTADNAKNAAGDDATPPDFKVNVFANVIRPIYVSKAQILGANPAWHVIIPLIHQSVDANGLSDSATGLGDIYVSPLILGWHKDNFHWVAALDIICPTGEYDSKAMANIGSNHWTYEPAFAVSYIQPKGFTASAKLMYDVHTKNQDTDYKTGDQFHMDYNLGYQLNDNWAVGIGGYFLKGLKNDSQDVAPVIDDGGGDIPSTKGTSSASATSVKVADSKQQVIAIGPSVKYSKGKLSLILEPNFEFKAKNRPEGISTWFKAVYSF